MRLRFPFSTEDQQNVEAIQAHEEPSAPVGLGTFPYPQALRLGFTVRAQRPVPQVRPLFGGELTFIADPPTAGKKLPDWSEVTEDTNDPEKGFDHWVTTGRIVVRLGRGEHELFAQASGAPEICPTAVSYGRVQLTREFLFGALVGRNNAPALAAEPVSRKDSPHKVEPKDKDGNENKDWWRHAIAGFLRGNYSPTLAEGDAPADDDITRCAMPTVLLDATSRTADLSMSAAFSRNFRDAPVSASLDDRPAELDGQPVDKVINGLEPNHGLVPARLVLLSLARGNNLIDGQADAPVANVVLADDPPDRFKPIRFRRTWRPTTAAEYSLLLAGQTALVEDAETHDILVNQRIPAHGVLYCVKPEDGKWPVTVNVSIVDGGALWLLDTGADDIWRQPEATAAVEVPLDEPATILVRSGWARECLTEPHYRSGGDCTYRTLRRFVRAYIDNRIAGGRLSADLHTTDPETRALIDAALGNVVVRRPPQPSFTVPGVDLVANGQPSITFKGDKQADADSPERNDAYSLLNALMRDALYPGPIPDPPNPGPNEPNLGQLVYALWLTFKPSGATARPYYDQYLGHGAPGMLKFLGFVGSAGYTHLLRTDGEAKATWLSRVTQAVRENVRFGSPLQFWQWELEYLNLHANHVQPPGFGHSMYVVRIATDADAGHYPRAVGAGEGFRWQPGIVAADQYGLRYLPVREVDALSLNLAAPLEADRAYDTIRLRGLPAGQSRRLRHEDELFIGEGTDAIRVIVSRANKPKPQEADPAITILRSSPLDLKVNSFTPAARIPEGTPVTRPAYRTLVFTYHETDIDMWITGNWAT